MLRIPQTCVEEILAHCQSRYPKEACGLLAGAGDAVTQVYPMTNVEDSPVGYAMDPKEQLKVLKEIRNSGLEIVGIYHSHVASEATPSQKDVRLAFYPEVSYLIVSLSDMQKPVLRSFKIKDEKVTEEEIKIIL